MVVRLFPTPDHFLVLRSHPPYKDARLGVACPDFDGGVWRRGRLAAHLTDWIPEFVFRPEDLPSDIRTPTALRKIMEQAVAHLYGEDVGASRGELGELLLHICCRQFFRTYPAVSKLYYKTSSNDVVKGFDIVHTKLVKSGSLELWLGEAKFYKSGSQAIRDAVASIKGHLDRGFMNAEKIMLGGKISPMAPGYEQLQWIFEPDTPLDQIFQRIVIPVLVAYNSAACVDYRDSTSYDEKLFTEVSEYARRLRKGLPQGVRIKPIFVPMNTKLHLQQEFDKRLKAYRIA